ncbi:UDP-N-acetylmuramoyl-tripeptide--D-alanyl-D-alanine ligase [Oceanicola sp. 502str15]|uniref:UDP-N-acetylmuramoyl-tripeptide--D-alanyl-D- alanine ligase n=1 Tax=Oceanicola sp. 502str15 TaxID=2696061 RepID=UPI002094BDE2|nr:UDP-N-acetylmuramoyl-tripeptide--D-alanyl-D-alanine ligase [Oceanicola sp. 502str15]MCO6381430.1 UDP-N-acetylmuramoyl-tripeptide--D-alanyl-D-alanine ligase [Oceanicola sp. 502str15]
MSALWTAAEAAAATGGQARGDWAATGLSIDSRSIAPGELFVALTDVRDGHDFVADALAKGAAAALVSRVPEGCEEAPLLVVGDVLEGLEALGRAGRARTRAKVAGVTGSVGKTSTKEMLRAILARQGVVHAAEKSFNNHWGVPLTLARMPVEADFAVIEIGMSNPGEIAPLARMARPDVAMITTVAPAHMAAFGSLEGIAREKASIFEGLEPGGVAVINADLETTPILREAAEAAGGRIATFGKDGDFALGTVMLSEGQTVAEARLHDQPAMFKLTTPGTHFAMNALGALAVAEALGADLGLATADLSKWTPYEGRGAREEITTDPARAGGFLTLFDDSYNANPASMAASLEMLAATAPRDGIGRVRKGRRIAVIGDMLELGPDEQALHAALAGLEAMEQVHTVHTVGPLAHALHAALPEDQRGFHAPDGAAMAREVSKLVDAGDVVLVKASLGTGLARVVDAIRKMGQAGPK